MNYLSTRGLAPQLRFSEILLGGLASDGGLYVPETYPRFTDAELAAMRGMNYRELAFAVLSRLIDDIPARRPAHADRQDLHRRRLSLRHRQGKRRGHHPAEDAGARPARAGAVERPDAGVQGHGDAAARQPVRVRAGPMGDNRRRTEHPRRHLGRYRLRRRIRDARQARHPRLHAVARARHDALPAGADVCPAGRQHPQPGDPRRVRPVPGHRQGGVERSRFQDEAPHRRGQFDQLGARRGAERVLLQGLFRGDARQRPAGLVLGAVGQLRQRLRRPHRAPDGPADRQADRRHQRERRARRVLQDRRLPSASGNEAHLQPVDGHFQGVQLRALRVRPGRTRCRQGPQPVELRWSRAAASI